MSGPHPLYSANHRCAGLSNRISITTCRRAPIWPWLRTRLNRERFNRRNWEGWSRSPKWEDSITVTSGEPLEKVLPSDDSECHPFPIDGRRGTKRSRRQIPPPPTENMWAARDDQSSTMQIAESEGASPHRESSSRRSRIFWHRQANPTSSKSAAILLLRPLQPSCCSKATQECCRRTARRVPPSCLRPGHSDERKGSSFRTCLASGLRKWLLHGKDHAKKLYVASVGSAKDSS